MTALRVRLDLKVLLALLVLLALTQRLLDQLDRLVLLVQHQL